MGDAGTSVVADGAMSVEEAIRFTGLGQTELYKRMREGSLAYVKCGKRRLIPRRALVALLAAGLVDPDGSARAGETRG